MKKLKEILDQEKKSIYVKISENRTDTLATTFHKPVEEANPRIRFG